MTRAVLLAVAVAALAVVPSSGATPLRATDLGTAGVPVQGIVATAQTFVQVPPGFAVRGGTVDLRFRHSPLLLADRSTVTLVADGIPLGSTRLARASADRGRLRARLPALPGARGGFTLAARFTMRLTRDSCEDPRNAALWARVLPSTRIDADLVPARRSVGEALELLTPAERGDVLHVGLPSRPSAAELATAGTTVAAFGRAAAPADADPLVAAAAPGSDRPGVVVAGGPTLREALSDFGADAEPAAGEGVLAVLGTGAPRLLVGGPDDAGLRRAAASLAVPELTAPAGAVEVVRGRVPRTPRASLPWRESAASFEQLGIAPREVTGLGVSRLVLPADRPPGWTLDEGGELELVLEPGAGMRSDVSSVAVDVGGQPVGSRRLEPGGEPVRLRFALPSGPLDRDLQGRARRSVAVGLRFDLQVPQGRCVPVDEDAARVTVLGTSKLTLPHGEDEGRDLGRFPAPITGDEPAAVVVPDRASQEELTAGLQVAAAIGRWADPGAPLPRLVTAGALGAAAEDLDLVLVGRARTSARIDAPSPRAGEGVLALRPNPRSEDRTVLVVDGRGPALVGAARALARRADVERLAGSAVRVGDAAPRALTEAEPPGLPPVALAPVLEDDDGPLGDLPNWAVPAAVLLVAFLAFVVLLVRRRVQAARGR